jgi:hypothetical protein
MSVEQLDGVNMTERAASLEGMRLLGALERVGTNVFVVDANLTLVFMNEKAQSTIHRMRDAIHSLGVDPRQLMGINLDQL